MFDSLAVYHFLPFVHQLGPWSFKPGKPGQHRHGRPIRRRGPRDGRQITNLVYVGSSPTGGSKVRAATAAWISSPGDPG